VKEKLSEELSENLRKLKYANQKVKKELVSAPEGSLRLGKSMGKTQYFRYTREEGKQYISKDNQELAQILAQKDYDEKILRYTEKSIKCIEKLLEEYEDNKLEKIFLAEHPMRQTLITPVEPTYNQRIEKWLAAPPAGKGFSEEAPIITTNKGVRVRSKSEKIIADYFESVGIRYKYECPLFLKPYGVIYPDFTFISKNTGEEIYWEHEGMMDNPEYSKSAIQKIELYEKNGILPGENLILTFEYSTSSVNMSLVKMLAERYLL